MPLERLLSSIAISIVALASFYFALVSLSIFLGIYPF